MPERTLCRILFLALCLAPTVLVSGWTAVLHSPAYRSAVRQHWAEEFTRNTSLGIRPTQLRRLRNGDYQLGQVELLGVDGAPLAVAHEVRIEQSDGVPQWRASRLELRRDALEQLWDTLDHRALRSVSQALGQWHLSIAEAKIECGDRGVERLLEVDGVLRLAGDVRSLEVRFVCPEELSTRRPPPIELIVAHRVAGSESPPPGPLPTVALPAREPPLTHIKLHAGAGIPARLLSEDLRRMAGERCRLFGQAHAVRENGSWSVKVHDTRLQDIDLSRWSSGAATIRAMAQLDVTMAAFVDGRPVQLDGRLAAEDGELSSEALQALTQHLEVDAPAHAARSTSFGFRQLAVRIWLRPHWQEGLALMGDCPGPHASESGEHVILVDSRGTALLASRPRYVSHGALQRALAASGIDQLVASRRAPSPLSGSVAAQPAPARSTR
ncbi:MAG: hypothetical protein KDB14_33800 [Planctomycetales bacterium]|nr:hypothetical protein [Planctomycetales bacterium]